MTELSEAYIRKAFENTGESLKLLEMVSQDCQENCREIISSILVAKSNLTKALYVMGILLNEEVITYNQKEGTGE